MRGRGGTCFPLLQTKLSLPDEVTWGAASLRKCSVIILNYATPDLAIACAKSALADIAGLDANILIVDNGSPDDSAARLSHWRVGLPPGAPVDVILSPANAGYAGGNNIGLRACQSEFAVLLNSDTLVRPGAFSAMLTEMQSDEGLGILGSRIVGPDGKDQISRFRFPSPFGEFIEAAGYDLLHRIFRSAVVPIFPAEPARPDWIGFPCVMLRRKMIDEIGPLDEGYFLYFEDVDYCRRAAAAGWRIAVCGGAEVMHLIGASSRVEESRLSGARLPAYYYASRSRYFRKWFGEFGWIAANWLWNAGRAFGSLRRLAGKAPAPAPSGKGLDIWTDEKEGRPDGAAPFPRDRT